tara:strand:+ start:29908 stop:30147 length:240 start_codon:yes stop_codon:yes gene_type:complete
LKNYIGYEKASEMMKELDRKCSMLANYRNVGWMAEFGDRVTEEKIEKVKDDYFEEFKKVIDILAFAEDPDGVDDGVQGS